MASGKVWGAVLVLILSASLKGCKTHRKELAKAIAALRISRTLLTMNGLVPIVQQMRRSSTQGTFAVRSCDRRPDILSMASPHCSGDHVLAVI